MNVPGPINRFYCILNTNKHPFGNNFSRLKQKTSCITEEVWGKVWPKNEQTTHITVIDKAGFTTNHIWSFDLNLLYEGCV